MTSVNIHTHTKLDNDVCVYIDVIMILFQLSKQMGGVVKGLDKVMQSMDLEKVKGYSCYYGSTSFSSLQISKLLL